MKRNWLLGEYFVILSETFEIWVAILEEFCIFAYFGKIIHQFWKYDEDFFENEIFGTKKKEIRVIRNF